MPHPSPTVARARLAGLTRHRGADDPAVLVARREVRTAYARRHIAELRLHLTDAERAELAAALLSTGGLR